MDAMVEFEKGEIIMRRWVIERPLAGGAFGSVFVAVDQSTGTQCALKMEAAKTKRDYLKMELNILRKLTQVTHHCCQFLGYGTVGNRAKFVAMTLLGDDLYNLRKKRPHERFRGETVARLTIECLEAIQALHSIGYIHRDIKPANFAIGMPPDRARTVHLIDFGLSRAFLSRGQLRPPRPNAGFHGTVRYASITAHYGRELGRRDDLLSLMYAVVEFRTGQLPWRAVRDEKKVLTMKCKFVDTLDQLTKSKQMEDEYAEIGRQVTKLTYADEPDYASLCALIQAMQVKNRFPTDGPFEWEE